MTKYAEITVEKLKNDYLVSNAWGGFLFDAWAVRHPLDSDTLAKIRTWVDSLQNRGMGIVGQYEVIPDGLIHTTTYELETIKIFDFIEKLANQEIPFGRWTMKYYHAPGSDPNTYLLAFENQSDVVRAALLIG